MSFTGMKRGRPSEAVNHPEHSPYREDEDATTRRTPVESSAFHCAVLHIPAFNLNTPIYETSKFAESGIERIAYRGSGEC